MPKFEIGVRRRSGDVATQAQGRGSAEMGAMGSNEGFQGAGRVWQTGKSHNCWRWQRWQTRADVPMSPRADGGGGCYVGWSVKHHPLDLGQVLVSRWADNAASD